MEATENFCENDFPDSLRGGTSHEEDTESEDEDEDVEPQLKYKRIGSDLMAILNKDAASCVSVHPKFIALGTHWGMIHVLDHCGNCIRSKELTAHSTTVNQITIDDNGDYLASCSDDGKVVINGLYNTENNQVINFDRPVKAVAMDPQFSKAGSSRHFVTGDDKLILNEKGFLGRHKSYVLHQGEGPIRSVKWKGNYIAWANDLGVKVYDLSSRRRITYIAKDDPKLRADMYRCSLCWKDSSTLLISWCDRVKICVVKERENPDARDLPNRYVEIVNMFTTEFFVCGIAPYGCHLVLLTYNDDEVHQEGGRPIAARPHLRIVDAGMGTYDEINNDALTIRGFEEYRCNDYHLESIVDENMYMILSPKDMVVASPRDQDDHISWLIDHYKFEEAMAAAIEHSSDLKVHTVQGIGRRYLDFLLEEREYDDAARLCVKILGRNKALWEEEVYKFAKIRQLKIIAPYLPQREPMLSPGIYEMVLNEFLQTDHVGFEKLVRDWPSDLYSIQTVVNAVLDKVDRDRNNPILLQCLAELYTHDKKHDKALEIFLRLKNKRAFQLIHRYNLFDSISDKIVLLMEYDNMAAVHMFLENMGKIPIEKVVHQLEHHRELLHIYLHEMFLRDTQVGQDYHALQVKLYAEYDRSRLLVFLQQSNYYPLQAALEECQVRAFIPEMVFLLGRMGNTKQALELITNELGDVNRAIDFCKEQNDRDLWEDLINYSIDKPLFIKGLLQNIGTHVDPIILIQQIQADMEIPGLRDSLVKILHDYNLQISLREGCKKILVADCFSLLDKLVKTQRKALCIEGNQVCHICNESIVVLDIRFASHITVFYCKHSIHDDCLPAHCMESCPICSAQKRSPGSAMASGRR